MTRLIDSWSANQAREEICSELTSKYEIYSKQLFSSYEPLAVANQNVIPRHFFDRLELWLRNFSTDEDQWNAFHLVEDIFYVGKQELVELYRVAFEVIVPDWLSQIQKISLIDEKYKEKIEAAMEKTWFCPITDSLKISAFRHVNHIEHPDFFPDWRSLAEFADSTKLVNYIGAHKIEQVVLLEDFVGSGKQITDAVEYAARICGVPVLVMPLVIGSSGNEKIADLIKPFQAVTFSPIIVLGSDTVVSKKPIKDESNAAFRARALSKEYGKVSGDKEPFGFEKDQGYLFVSEANCPNNTLKLIHATKKWNPLFPRSGRKK
jgi:hypothetical protein